MENEQTADQSEPESYPCNKCSKIFKTQRERRRHNERVHLKLYHLSCSICKKMLSSKKSLTRHMLIHNPSDKPKNQTTYRNRFHSIPVSCPVCAKVLSNKYSLAHHSKLHARSPKPKKLYTLEGPDQDYCVKCDRGFKFASIYRMHYQNVHTDKVKCSVCSKLIVKNNLKRHLSIHENNEEPVTNVYRGKLQNYCKQCGTGYKTAALYRDHYNVVHLKRTHVICPICEGKYYKSYMQRHMKVHEKRSKIKSELKKWSCDLCSAAFSDKNNYLRHVKNLHQNKSRHTCVKCGKTFTRKRTLNLHLSQHNQNPKVCKKYYPLEPEFVSPFTAFKSTDFAKVVDHLSAGEPQPDTIQECDRCREIMWTKDYALHYQRHILTDPKYECHLYAKCQACELKFPTEDSANLHKRICDKGEGRALGDGLPTYPCCSCSAKSKDKMVMKLHNQRVHNKVLPGDKSGEWKNHHNKKEEGMKLDYECYLCSRPLGWYHTATRHIGRCEGVERTSPVPCLVLVQ